jgi:hypothetical protein
MGNSLTAPALSPATFSNCVESEAKLAAIVRNTRLFIVDPFHISSGALMMDGAEIQSIVSANSPFCRARKDF